MHPLLMIQPQNSCNILHNFGNRSITNNSKSYIKPRRKPYEHFKTFKTLWKVKFVAKTENQNVTLHNSQK